MRYFRYALKVKSLILDGLQHTRKWLLKHINVTEPLPDNVDEVTHARNITNIAFSEACIDLLEWDNNDTFPEVGTDLLIVNLNMGLLRVGLGYSFLLQILLPKF